ncbi:hypothetical protein B0F90DRAFT_1690248 [Multifurca ochricompacta]|uniref:Uncharacterized protein n=1 Tax=Multifurca ochricompacta TaxID=376703 RepID=A0AAD4QRZ5_9AGAM|nr:hypothetical protein B0F90DRAFT_1690248 [Multifurca ochricompacta]
MPSEPVNVMTSLVGRSSKGNKDVNNLLHTLRAEHFRRTLNTQRSPSGRLGPTTLPTSPCLTPSLPYAEIYAGPIPRSWATATTPAKVLEGPRWRETALSLFFARTDDTIPVGTGGRVVPCLADFCLRVVLDYFGAGADALEDLVPYLAPHHKKQLMRICAVRCPLPSTSLRVLLGKDHNQLDGELIIIESTSPPRPELFKAEHKQTAQNPEDLWDAEAGDGPSSQPLKALAIVSTTLLIPTLLALPPSLTRLALVHLSAAVPLHRLPDKCPLLEVLDISYNQWLGEPTWGGEPAIEMIAWGRWAYLKMLGCRDCGFGLEELKKVNEGRWEDVTIVI